jgi:hypothetical protein
MALPALNRAASWRRVSKRIGVATVAAFAAGALLWMYYGITRPTAGEPAAGGREWALNYRGRVAFLTDGELGLLVALFCVFVAGALAMVAIELMIRLRGLRRGPR